MTNIIEPINSYRVEEKDKLYVQFFDKKKQITNEDLQTVDILDENEKPIYELFVEIYNKEDPYSVLCKKVEGNNIAIRNNQGVIKRFAYIDFYKKAYDVYLERKQNTNKQTDSQEEIIRLKNELEKLKKQNKKEKVSKENIKTENNLTENNLKENNLE